MPNSNRSQGIWLPQTTPDNTCIPLVDFLAQGGQGGDVGQAFDYNSRAYQRVKLDSGATAATPNAAPASGDLLYWKDKANYIVTSDRRFALGQSGGNDGYRNQAAGWLRFTPTAAQIAAESYIDILQRGSGVSVASAASGADGSQIVAEAGADNRVVSVASGTAVVVKSLGVQRAAAVANVALVDVDIPNIP
jgi:hypothetical protein